MLSHWFTLIGLGLCLKTTRSYLTKLKQLLLALPPPSAPDPPLRTLAPPPHSCLCVVSKPLALLQSGLYPPLPRFPCPAGRGASDGRSPPPSTFNLFRAHGSIHTSTGGGDGCRRPGAEEAGRRRSALPVGRNDGTPGRAPCWIPLAQPNRVAPRRHGDVSVVLGTPSIHADLEKGGGGGL